MPYSITFTLPTKKARYANEIRGSDRVPRYRTRLTAVTYRRRASLDPNIRFLISLMRGWPPHLIKPHCSFQCWDRRTVLPFHCVHDVEVASHNCSSSSSFNLTSQATVSYGDSSQQVAAALFHLAIWILINNLVLAVL